MYMMNDWFRKSKERERVLMAMRELGKTAEIVSTLKMQNQIEFYNDCNKDLDALLSKKTHERSQQALRKNAQSYGLADKYREDEIECYA